MAHLRASLMTRAISLAVLGLVGGFSALFLLMLLRLAETMGTIQGFFGGAAPLLYLSVESVFLCLVIAAAYWTIRRRK